MRRRPRQQTCTGQGTVHPPFSFSFFFSLFSPYRLNNTGRRCETPPKLTGLSVIRIRRHLFSSRPSALLSEPPHDRTGTWASWACLDLRLAFLSPLPSAYFDGWMLRGFCRPLPGRQSTPAYLVQCLIPYRYYVVVLFACCLYLRVVILYMVPR